MRKITLYTHNANCEFFGWEADCLREEADRYGEENFIFEIEPDYSDHIAKITIAEPEMWVTVRDEYIEFDYSHTLKDYTIRTSDIISMEIEF